MNEQIKEFFKPERKKVILTFIIPYIFILFTILVEILFILLYSPDLLISLSDIGKIIGEYFKLSVVISLLLVSISTYPFICSLFSIYKFYKSKNLKGILSQKTTLALIIMGFTILNPVIIHFFFLIVAYTSQNLFYITTTQGVQAIDYSLNPTNAFSGIPFGGKIYSIEIFRNDNVFLDEEVRNTDDYYRIVSNFQKGDEIIFDSSWGNIFRETVENPQEYVELDVQNIGSKPIPMVRIEKISPNSPFTYFSKGIYIYRIDKFNQERMMLDEINVGWNVTNFSTYYIKNSDDFFEALNSAKKGDILGIAILNKHYGEIEVTSNITDWGIEVKDVEIR